ncbi:SpoIIAA family protein [Winogradskyella bathintestinalis]|uniref:STAS/SEC14 domain-containing protein n=1 Tax=Winogradskyella bathintestinalis TaxID=3035208 RepID=A0ABT7ZW47_9FLAO|nr:STAS/SEC14 domain-containing protein [Winogradskyella bathintestinalis]MDN3493242.1 STAS/SEC14 domain-containing protein [Winogradskyella bathintestinalis]
MINTDTTVHMIINSTTTENDFEMVFDQMKEINAKKGFFNLLLEVEDASNIKNFKSVGFISELKWFAVKNMRKYAVVTDVDWLENLIPVGNIFTPGIPMKRFDEDDIQGAIDWINAPTDNEKHGMAIMQ